MIYIVIESLRSIRLLFLGLELVYLGKFVMKCCEKIYESVWYSGSYRVGIV